TLWNSVARAGWSSGGPGVLFASAIDVANPCPADGEIRAASADAAFLFLDDTACAGAALNLARFLGADGEFDADAFAHAARLWTVALDISLTMGAYPSRRIAQRTWDYRPLALGAANLGGLLMRRAVPYDSDAGRAAAGAV